jgi:hypothetical protein
MMPPLRWLRILIVVAAISIAVVAIVLSRLWQERQDVSELDWPIAESVDVEVGGVTVT